MNRYLRRNLTVIALALATAMPVARAADAKVPETVAEHLAMSKSYVEKAAAWRAEAERHWRMAADFRKSHPDRKSGARNTRAAEMDKHCSTLARDAEKLAADAEDFAKYHRMRAAELEGR